MFLYGNSVILVLSSYVQDMVYGNIGIETESCTFFHSIFIFVATFFRVKVLSIAYLAVAN